MSLARSAARHQSGQILALLVVIAATLAVPLGWRGLAAIAGAPAEVLPESYLPALEARRERIPFDPGHIEGLRDMQPGYVIVGDSMGGRIDPARLTQLSDEFVAPILRSATGSAYWYLALHAVWDMVGARVIARAPWLASPPRWAWVSIQAMACGVLFAALLVLRSRTSLDFIYFQF